VTVAGWFAALAGYADAGTMSVVTFPFGEVFRMIVWPCLGLFLPFVMIAGVALWGVNLVFGKGR
jgi:hypothetical protein